MEIAELGRAITALKEAQESHDLASATLAEARNALRQVVAEAKWERADWNIVIRSAEKLLGQE